MSTSDLMCEGLMDGNDIEKYHPAYLPLNINWISFAIPPILKPKMSNCDHSFQSGDPWSYFQSGNLN